jgi:GT2 family glycosyltransferase
VDNGSENDILERLIKYLNDLFRDLIIIESETIFSDRILSSCTLLCLGVNLGYARGNNAGLELIFKDDEINNVLLINNDIVIIEDILEPMCEFLSQQEDCALVSPLLLNVDGVNVDLNCARKNVEVTDVLLYFFFFFIDPLSVKLNILKRQYLVEDNSDLAKREVLPIELPSGSCMLMKKSIWKELGGFDPNTFLYYEENILAKKIELIGRRNYLLPKLHCIHVGASSTKLLTSKILLGHSIDSALYYVSSYCNPGVVVKCILKIVRLNFKIQIELLDFIKTARKTIVKSLQLMVSRKNLA